MSSSEDEVKVKVRGDTESVAPAMRNAASAVSSGVAQMKSKLGELNDIGMKINAVFLAIGAVLAGGALFKEAVDETVKLTKESQELGKQLGTTATQASIIKVALDDVYVSQDKLTSAGNRITTTLRTNEKAFADLGVKTRDQNGNFRATFDIIQDVNKRLLQFREGTDRNIEGQKIYGRGWAEVAPTLRLTAEALENARVKAESLGLVVGQEGADQVARYRAAMNDVGDVVTGVKKAIGDALIPVLADLGEWLSTYGPATVEVMRKAIAGLLIAFYGIKFVVEEAYNILKAGVQQMVVLLLTLSDVAQHALRWDFTGAKQAWQNGLGQMRDIGSQFLADTLADWEEGQRKIGDVLDRSDGRQTAITRPGAPGAEGSSGGKAKGATTDTRFAEWQAQLEKLQEASGNYRREDLDGELRYWREKLALVTGNTEKDKALRLKIEHEIFGVKKQLAAQEVALAQETITQTEAVAQQGLDAKREQLRAARELGQITEAEEIIALRDLEQQKYAIEQQGIEARRKLAEADMVTRKKFDDQLILLHAKQVLAMQKSDNDAAIARKKQWESALAPIGNAIAQSVQGMIQGTLTLRRAIANLGQSIVGEFISMGVRKATAWVAGELAMTQATAAGTAVRTALEDGAAKQGILTTAASAIKKIAIRAVEVMASVYAAIAGIPYIGPFLAPAMAIAAGATVIGYIGRIASARGGYDIPSGVNPITQLHEREMVLPRQQADVIRDMATGSGGRSGGVKQVNISALDGRSVERLLRDPRSGLSRALRRLAANQFLPATGIS